MVGSISGVSGINPIVDRLNSISTDNNLIKSINTTIIEKQGFGNINANGTFKTYILDTASGGNVDIVTSDIFDAFEIDVTAFKSTAGSVAILIAYSGGSLHYSSAPLWLISDGSFSSGTYSNLEAAAGTFKHIINPSAISEAGTRRSIATTTLLSSGNNISTTTTPYTDFAGGDASTLIGNIAGSLYVNAITTGGNTGFCASIKKIPGSLYA